MCIRDSLSLSPSRTTLKKTSATQTDAVEPDWPRWEQRLGHESPWCIATASTSTSICICALHWLLLVMESAPRLKLFSGWQVYPRPSSFTCLECRARPRTVCSSNFRCCDEA
eukprot:2862122-Rhodomonas_salina.1